MNAEILADTEYYTYRGRHALSDILTAMGLSNGDIVVVQAFTCVAVPEAILHAGCKPVYVDIDPLTLGASVDALQKIFSELNAKAFILQYTYGVRPDLKRLMDLCEKHCVNIIEDCCHILPTAVSNSLVGQIGVAAFTSFEWGKPIPAGLGGALVVNDEDTIDLEKLRQLRSQKQQPPISLQIRMLLQYQLFKLLFKPSFYWQLKALFRFFVKYRLAVGNYATDAMQLDSKEWNYDVLPNVKRRVRKSIALIQSNKNIVKSALNYVSENLDNEWISVAVPKDKINSDLLRLPLLVEHKSEFLEYCRRMKIPSGDWFDSPVHPLKGGQLKSVLYQHDCHVAEQISKKIVTIPLDNQMTLSRCRKITTLLNRYGNDKKF
ncbi:MAG: DegT/DnrJ/EryC1/StrS family aminotransferase [Alphaproteobacteria bacterium]